MNSILYRYSFNKKQKECEISNEKVLQHFFMCVHLWKKCWSNLNCIDTKYIPFVPNTYTIIGIIVLQK